MRTLMIAASMLALLTTACGETADKPTDASTTPSTAAATSAEPCADDGARLPLSGVCAGRAINYLDIAEGGAAALPDGCEWVVNEAALAGKKQFLLYRAAKCGAVTAQLEFAAGARTGSLTLTRSAIAPGDGDKRPFATVISAAGDDESANAAIMALVSADLGAAEAAKCSVRKADAKGWPADALIVDVSAEEAAKVPRDEPRTACGKFGLHEDEPHFWRVFGGMAWFLQPTQDLHQDIEPGSLTVVDLNDDDSSDAPDKAS